MTVFERIKKLAKERGYSLTKLNDAAGLGTNSIYHWKTKTPGTDNLQKVANVLGVTVDYLLGDDDSSKFSSNKHMVELNNEDNYYTFDGKPVSKEDMELFKRLMRGK